MPREPANWYVMINDAQTGPLTRVELGVELNSGTISGESLVWKEGMVGWVPGAKVPELASLFTNPPKSPRAPPKGGPKKPEEKGTGLSDFDTSHFRLADLAADEGGPASRQMEFDTGHFNLAELKAEDDGQSRNLEFDTSHFRLAELKGNQGARAAVPKRIAPKGMEPAPIPEKAAKAGLKRLSTDTGKPPPPVKSLPPPVAAKPKAAPGKSTPPPSPRAPAAKASEELELAVERPRPAAVAKAPAKPAAKKPAAPDGFDPNKTSVDFMAYGQQAAQADASEDLFAGAAAPEPEEEVSDGAGTANAKALSKWAADEISSEEAPVLKAKRPPPPVPVPIAIPSERGVPLWVMIAGGVAIAVAVVLFLVMGD